MIFLVMVLAIKIKAFALVIRTATDNYMGEVKFGAMLEGNFHCYPQTKPVMVGCLHNCQLFFNTKRSSHNSQIPP